MATRSSGQLDPTWAKVRTYNRNCGQVVKKYLAEVRLGVIWLHSDEYYTTLSDEYYTTLSAITFKLAFSRHRFSSVLAKLSYVAALPAKLLTPSNHTACE